ncbi:MAG: PIN domain-containing protein [Ignavibacteria bacterium]
MTKLFVDTDICLDLLSGRKPFNSVAEKLFSLADSGKIKIYVSSLSFSNIDYVLQSQYKVIDSRTILAKFKRLVNVLAVDDKIIELAISSDFKDFEDSIQHFTAVENSLKILLTRNLKDYERSAIQVMNPETFLMGDLN